MLRRSLCWLGLALLLVSCGSRPDPLVGKWEEANNTRQIEFLEGGTVTVRTAQGETVGKYSRLDQGRVRVEFPQGPLYSSPQTLHSESVSSDEVLLAFGEEHPVSFRRVTAFSSPPADHLAMMKGTLADIRSIAVAIEAYGFDNDHYPIAPEGPVQALSAVLVPTYIQNLPQHDGWGSPILWTGDDGATYQLVSVGSDRARDQEWPGGPVDSFAQDVVFRDGRFFQWPEGILANR